MGPSFEQTLMTHTKGLFLQYERILSSGFGEKMFKSLVHRNQIFAFFHFQSSAKMPWWSFTIILTNYDGLDLHNLLA